MERCGQNHCPIIQNVPFPVTKRRSKTSLLFGLNVINSPLFQISLGLLLGEEGTILQGAWLIIFPTSIFSESPEVQSESSTEFAGLPEVIESTFELKIHGERLDGSVDGLCFVTDEKNDP